MKLSIHDVNAMDEPTFIHTFASIVEHSPWVAQGAYQQKPFANLNALHQAMVQVVNAAGSAAWEKLLNLHPELSGKEAQSGTLTHYSQAEQSGIGLNALSPEQFAHMREFNQRYREKFGFPMVICVRQVANLAALFAEQSRRFALSRDEELITGVEQVFEIARLRLEEILKIEN